MKGQVAGEIALGDDGGDGFFVAPKPAEGLGKDRAAVLGVVAVALDVVEAAIVAHVAEGGVEVFVGGGPVTEGVVEIAAGILEEDAEGFALGFADEGRVGVAAAEVYKTADGREHLAELVGAFPSDGESGDTAAAGTADRTLFRVGREGELFRDLGQNFLDQKAGIAIAEGIVFHATIAGVGALFGGRLRGVVARVDKDGDGHGHLAARDQIVEDGGHAPGGLEVEIVFAVLEDHHSRGAVGLVLGGDVDPPVTGHAGKNLRFQRGHLSDGAAWDAGARLMVGGGDKAFGGEVG